METYYITPEQYEIAAKNGIRKEDVNRRVRGAGWKIEQAITLPPGQRNKNPYKELARKNGISVKTYEDRIRNGWGHKQAATTQPKTYCKNDPAMIEKAAKNGISYDTYVHRVRKLGWTEEEAASVKVLPFGSYLKGWKGDTSWKQTASVLFVPGLAYYIATGKRKKQSCPTKGVIKV